MANKSRTPEPVSNLPMITAEDVRAYRQSGQLARVDVYPIPESQSPDSPSSIVRSLPESVAASGRAKGKPDVVAPNAGYRFVIDGAPDQLVTATGVIGRNPDPVVGSQAIAIDDPGRSLSRNHLGFEVDARGRLLVYDMQSANGSEIITVDDDRIECLAGKRYPVGIGDTLLLGNFSVTVARG